MMFFSSFGSGFRAEVLGSERIHVTGGKSPN